MHKEHVTTIDPSSLSDQELIRFAKEAIADNILGMTRTFQFELLKRFTDKTN
jgi:hypothetical protein